MLLIASSHVPLECYPHLQPASVGSNHQTEKIARAVCTAISSGWFFPAKHTGTELAETGQEQIDDGKGKSNLWRLPALTLFRSGNRFTRIGMNVQDLSTPMQILRSLALPFVLLTSALSIAAAAPPRVGDKVVDFSLRAVDGASVRLLDLTRESTIVLVVLRGFPGYQCPFCQRQVQDFVAKAQNFTDAGVKVVFIYPGPPDKLNERANESLAGKNFPPSFVMLLDPDYKVTNLYGLRWDAPQETAYPSTFLIDRQGTVLFSKVVKSHGGRTGATEMLDLLPKKSAH